MIREYITTQYETTTLSRLFYKIKLPLVYDDGEHIFVWIQLSPDTKDIIYVSDQGRSMRTLSRDVCNAKLEKDELRGDFTFTDEYIYHDSEITNEYIFNKYKIYKHNHALFLGIRLENKLQNIDDALITFGNKLLDIDNYKLEEMIQEIKS